MNKTEAIKMLIKYPFQILKDGIRMQEQKDYQKQLKTKYGLNQLPTIDLLDLFPDLDETVSPYSFLSGTSLITDLALLKLLARKQKGGSYLEIGSWRGESIANVNDVLEDCVSVTLSEKEMQAYGFSNDFIKVHGIFSKDCNYEAHGHDSKTFDFTSLNKKFDLIFIDGDHSYGGVLNDTQKILPLLKDDKSIIVWHDYSFNTEDVRYTTLKAILDGMPKEMHKDLYHVSNTMCAVYIPGLNLQKSFTKFPSYPTKKFSLQLKAEKI